MGKFPLVGVLALFPAIALVLVVGCTNAPKVDPKPAEDKKVAESKDKKGGGKGGEPIKTATEATIKGKVKFTGGEAPKPAPETAMKEHKDAPYCEKGGDFEKVKQVWLVDDKGGVANVVISLAPPTGMKFDMTDAVKKPFETPAVLDQPHCHYIPHMVAVLADVQPLLIKNSAKVSHNVKTEQVGDNPTFDSGVMETGKEFTRKFSRADRPIGVQCSMHQWMNAQIHVFTHPYFAVSKHDGSFEIKNVPIDTELTVYMWHESKKDRWEAKKMKFNKGDNSLELEISK